MASVSLSREILPFCNNSFCDDPNIYCSTSGVNWSSYLVNGLSTNCCERKYLRAVRRFECENELIPFSFVTKWRP